MSAKGIIESVIEQVSFMRQDATCPHHYRKDTENLKLLCDSVIKNCEKIRNDLDRALELIE